MRQEFKLINVAVSGAVMLMIAGCGGADISAPATTPVTTTVVDGAIRNAMVCVDRNGNGKCDADEVQGQTDSLGNVTLAVPLADVGKYPLIAVIGTDAVDAENGPVTVAYTMAAPADQSGVVSPLTTLVQHTVATTGATTADAAKTVQDALGVTVSLFEDFTKVAEPTNGSLSAKTLARLIVVTTQAQTTALASAVGTTAIDGATITRTDLDKVIQKKLIELLPTLVSAMTSPAVLAAATPAAKEIALAAAAADAVVNVSGLTPASLTTLVAVNNAPAVAAVVAAPVASVQLVNLSFSSAMKYISRVLTGSVAQNTPDSAGNTRYVERRSASISTTSSTGASSGSVAQWGAGSDPTRNADLHWNGGRWANCPINFENTAGPRDAKGSNVYNYCDNAETGKTRRASFDIGGKTMASVYTQIRAAGYTNLTLAEPDVLASATFPTGALMTFQSSMPLTSAVAYYPGSNAQVKQYSAEVAAGVDSAAACRATTFPSRSVSSLESLISSHAGAACVYAAGASFVYAGTKYGTEGPNDWYGNSTLNLGTIGTVALNTGSTAPGYFSGNTRLVVAFKGTGSNPVTYLACQERFTDGSVRNCAAIGTGTYTVATLGDGRVLTLNNLPVQAATLPFARVFVERGGFVFAGYQNKLQASDSARLNTAATQALLTQLGLVPVDPEVTLALTAASYQGSWDIVDATRTDLNGVNVVIGTTGASTCRSLLNGAAIPCALTFSNLSSGAFTLTEGPNAGASGNFDFLASTGSGSYHAASASGTTEGSFVAQRR